MIISRTGVPAVPDLAMPPGGSERSEEPTEVEGRGRGAPLNIGVGAKVSSLNMYCSQKKSALIVPPNVPYAALCSSSKEGQDKLRYN